MVIYSYNKRIAISFLLIAISFYSYSQDITREFNSFNSYSNWGFSITPILFEKASITRNYGSINLENKDMFSIQVGAKYSIFNDRKISLNMGFKLTATRTMNSYFKLSKEDVYENFNGTEERIKEYGSVYLSIPFGVEYKRKINNQIIFNSNLGLDVFYLTNSRNDLSIELASDELNEIREIFAVYQETQKNSLQASINFSAGIYFIFKKYLVQINMVYNKNFQNLLEGEYQFGNLFVSEPTRGDYIVSGDYVGLSTTIYFKKRNKKGKKKK